MGCGIAGVVIAGVTFAGELGAVVTAETFTADMLVETITPLLLVNVNELSGSSKVTG